MRILTVILIATFFSACGGNKSVKQTDRNAIANIPVATDEVIIPADSGIVRLYFTNDVAQATIRKNERQSIYLHFKVEEGYREIKGFLSSKDSTANVRFSQIQMPDGTMDGPFGREITYELTGNGEYIISVNENMMAGDPWSGIFDVKMQLIK